MNNIKICLDAGHYGKYNRSPVVPDYYESEMSWKLHLLLKSELEKCGFVVVTTRAEQEKDLDLFKRGKTSKGCSLFLSLHSNASGTESVDYPLAIALAEDNRTKIDETSQELAGKLVNAIYDVMKTNQRGRTITKKADFDRNKDGLLNDEYYGVLHGAKQVGTPAIILEHSFHTNTNAAKWLLVEDNLKKLAVAEAKVIAEYYTMGVNKMEKKEHWAEKNLDSLVKKGLIKSPEAHKDLDKTITKGEVFALIDRLTDRK